MTSLRTRLRTAALCAAVALCAPFTDASAQDSMVVRGRLTGPDNAAVANQRVVLHRVAGEDGGMSMASSETNDAGEFELRAPMPPDTAAVYFAATLYGGELYLGPMFRPHQADAVAHDIQVGVPGTSANAMFGTDAGQGGVMPQAIGRPRTNRNWMLLVIPMLGVAAVAVYALIPRARIAADRALLIRIAELDERMTTATPAQRESLQSERARLVLQLREGG